MQETDSTTYLPIELSADEFLERQAADASAAMIDTLRDVFDIREHIRHHPWWSVGVAGLAGVATAKVLQRHHSGNNTDDRKTSRSGSAMSPILKTLVSESLKFLIPTLFTGAVLSKTEEQIDQATDPSFPQ